MSDNTSCVIVIYYEWFPKVATTFVNNTFSFYFTELFGRKIHININ